MTRHLSVPARVLGRFCAQHPEIDRSELPFLLEAYRQWVRIEGRAPGTHCQPSLAVDHLLGVYEEDDAAWAALPPEARVARVPVRAPESRDRLAATHMDAHVDQSPSGLPWLFDVDEVLGIVNGRLYQGTCTTPGCRDELPQRDAIGAGRTCLHKIPNVMIPSG